MNRLLVVLLALAMAVGCAPSQPSGIAPGGSSQAPATLKRIVMGILDEPNLLQGGLSQRGGSEFQELAHAGLVQPGGEGDPIAQLAEAVPTTDNGLWQVFPDGSMRTTWTLREGALWQDGVPLTTDDLLFSAQVVRDDDVPIRKSPGYAAIVSINAVDARTISVDWKAPFIQADALFSRNLVQAMPKHLAEDAYNASKTTFLDLPLWKNEFVGAGPFKIKQWEPGSLAVLSAFDSYVMGRPKLDEIEVRFFSDANVMVTSLLAGAIEITGGRGLTLADVSTLTTQWRVGEVRYPQVGWIQMHPQFTNPDPPVIGDVRFRKALMHAMDRQAMADTLQFGLVGVAQPWLSPEDPRFEAVKPSLVSYEYDPARAVQMIEGLGYTRAAEGLFQDQAGRPLSVEARSIPSDLYQSAMLAVANYWQKSGVGVTTVPIPAQRTTDIAYRATRPGFEVLQQPTDPQNLSLFRIANVPRPENNYRGPTGPNYMDKDYDDLVGKYFATIPAAERTQVLAQILHQVSDQLILMPLFYTTEPSAVSTRIRGVPVKKPLNVTTWNAAQWDVR